MTALSIPTAYYAAGVAAFLGGTTESILGSLTAKSVFGVDPAQRDAWIGEIHVLKAALDYPDNSTVLLVLAGKGHR